MEQEKLFESCQGRRTKSPTLVSPGVPMLQIVADCPVVVTTHSVTVREILTLAKGATELD